MQATADPRSTQNDYKKMASKGGCFKSSSPLFQLSATATVNINITGINCKISCTSDVQKIIQCKDKICDEIVRQTACSPSHHRLLLDAPVKLHLILYMAGN